MIEMILSEVMDASVANAQKDAVLESCFKSLGKDTEHQAHGK